MTSHVMLDTGYASARIDAKRVAVVVLKASYDPGWQVNVDGRPATTQMIAPAYVGVRVSSGHHIVTFTYKSNAHAELLLLIALGSAIICILYGLRRPQGPSKRRAKSIDT